MTEFEIRIESTFADYDKIIPVLRKYDFEVVIENSLSKLTYLLSNESFEDIPNLVGVFLVLINEKLREIKIKNHKIILERVMSHLFGEIVSLLRRSKKGRACLDSCTKNLATVCEIYNYNFNELNNLLKLKSGSVIPIEKKNKKNIFYYEWMGKEEELIELIKDIQSKGIIKGVVNFKKIFDSSVKFDHTFQGFHSKQFQLLVLVDILKSKKIIKVKGGKGHFKPLFLFGRDNGKKLFSKKPFRLHEKIKRNKTLYPKIYKEMEECITANCSNL